MCHGHAHPFGCCPCMWLFLGCCLATKVFWHLCLHGTHLCTPTLTHSHSHSLTGLDVVPIRILSTSPPSLHPAPSSPRAPPTPPTLPRLLHSPLPGLPRSSESVTPHPWRGTATRHVVPRHPTVDSRTNQTQALRTLTTSLHHHQPWRWTLQI